MTALNSAPDAGTSAYLARPRQRPRGRRCRFQARDASDAEIALYGRLTRLGTPSAVRKAGRIGRSRRTQGRCGVGLSHRRSQLIFKGITHLGVGRFYNFDIGGIVLTIVSRMNGRINPVGTEIVCVVHWARCVVWCRPCLNRDGTVSAEGAQSLSHKVEDKVMFGEVIVGVLWAFLLIGVPLTIGVLTDSLNTYIVI